MANFKYYTDTQQRIVDLSDTVVIGRDEGCDLRITGDHLVSRRHAQTKRDSDGSWILEDLGSRNGTFVERAGETVRITGAMTLMADDVVHVGDARLVFDAGPDTVVADPHDTVMPNQTRLGNVVPVRVDPPPVPVTEEPAKKFNPIILAGISIVVAGLAVVLALLISQL